MQKHIVEDGVHPGVVVYIDVTEEGERTLVVKQYGQRIHLDIDRAPELAGWIETLAHRRQEKERT